MPKAGRKNRNHTRPICSLWRWFWSRFTMPVSCHNAGVLGGSIVLRLHGEDNRQSVGRW